PRIVVRSLKQQPAPLDLQLLAIGFVLAVHHADVAGGQQGPRRRLQDIELAHQLAVQTKAVEVDIVADLQVEIDEHWNARDHRGLGTLIINDDDILRHPRRTRRQSFDIGTGVRNPRDAFDANGFAVRGKVNGRADIGIDLLLLQYL